MSFSEKEIDTYLKITEQVTPEDKKAVTAAFINEETRIKTLKSLGLLGDPTKLSFYSIDNVSRMAEEELVKLKYSSENALLLENLNRWVQRVNPEPWTIDAQTIGIALILRMFRYQYGDIFPVKLEKLNPGKAMRAFEKTPFQFNSAPSTIISRLMSSPEHEAIPIYQPNIQDSLSRITCKLPGLTHFIERGAGGMYRIIEDSWQDLSPLTQK
ncbi:MAG: hypothetical protein WCV81_05560 [Microgenomates group bacterium]|jgi:hypothetical protein